MNGTEKNNHKMPTHESAVQREVLETIFESTGRLTQRELEKNLSRKLSIAKQAVSAAIKDLVSDGELAYTYRYGCSFLEKSFNRPVRISKRIVLKPHGMMYSPKPHEFVIALQQGAAFGSGEHPTTRLAVRGIEAAFSEKPLLNGGPDIRVLDIGTGSGVLVIAAVVLGAGRALGIDIDPCAVAEARKNVKLNQFETQIEILDQNIEDIADTFSLILANLRYPTLKQLRGHISGRLEGAGALVVSGVKTDEVGALVDVYAEQGFQCTWNAAEKDWAGLVFVRESHA